MKRLTTKRFIRGLMLFVAAVAVSAFVLLVQNGLALVMPMWAVLALSVVAVLVCCVWSVKDEDLQDDSAALLPDYSGQPTGLTRAEVQAVFGSALTQLAESNEFLLLTRGTDGQYYISYIADSDDELVTLQNLEL